MLLRSFFISCIIFNLGFTQEKSKPVRVLTSKNLNNNQKITLVDSMIQRLSCDNNSVRNETENYIDWLFKNKKYEKLIAVSLFAIKNEEISNKLDSLHFQKLYYRLGLSKYQLKAYNESIVFFQTALKFQKNNEITGEIYSNLGKCYHKKSDYHNAINHYRLGQNLLIKHSKLDALFKNYINISQSYNSLETIIGYEKARNCFLKADSITPLTSIGKKYRHYVQMGLADSYNYNEILNIPKASLHYQKALTICSKINDSINLGKIYSNFGNLYCTTNPDLAIKKQLKSLLFFSKKDSLQYSINFSTIAYSYAIKGNHDKSLENYLKSINYLTNIDNNLVSLFKGLNKAKLSYKNNLLKDVKELGNVYFEQSLINKSKKILNMAIYTYALADQLLDLILIESQEFQSKLFWRKQSSELYGKAIEACYAANDPEKAFFFMEKNKALLLTKGLKNQQIKQALDLPDSLVNLEIELKKNIYSLKHLESSPTNTDSIAIALLSNQRALQKLKDSIHAKFINYKSIDMKTDIITLDELQQSLREDEAVLSYNISQYDDYGLITAENNYTPVIKDCKYGVKTFHPGFGLLITRNKVDFFKINTSENTQNKIEHLISQMRSPFKTKIDIKNYNEEAYQVYSMLLPSEELKTRIGDKKLRIIPDNYLNYLPFEALKTTKGNNPNYWIEKNEISYAFSNSFLANIRSPKTNTSTTFAGFAPVNFKAISLPSLANSIEELRSVTKSFSGVNYTYKNATKKQFLKTLPNYDIIHLATHADAQDSIAPWIAFQNDTLLQDELELTNNQAKMVVLSGCNTLLGKQEIGEGVMSLARGFFQSGSKSVVSSLWSVNDASTPVIMNGFYKNLNRGLSKSKALQDAKLNYLKTHSLSEASPYYWASFVVLGDSSPIRNSIYDNLWFAFLLIPILIVSLLLIKRIRKNQN